MVVFNDAFEENFCTREYLSWRAQPGEFTAPGGGKDPEIMGLKKRQKSDFMTEKTRCQAHFSWKFSTELIFPENDTTIFFYGEVHGS